MNRTKQKLPQTFPGFQKVLVVDDDPVICEFMKELLSESFEVSVVSSGLSALDVLHFERPDIIFVDIVLPDMDGRELCRAIRRIDGLESVYLTVFSGILAEETLDIHQMEADAFVAKGPITKMAESIHDVLNNPAEVRSKCLNGGIVGIEGVFPRKMTTELLGSQRRCKLLIQSLSQGVVEVSRDGRILFINARAASFVGRTESTLLGTSFESLFKGDDHLKIWELLNEPESQTKEPVEYPLVRLNGRVLTIERLPLLNDRGTQTLILTDVTRRIKEQESFKNGEDRLKRIIEHFSDAVILADGEGIVRFVNPAAIRLFRRNAEDFVGSHFGFPLMADETSELDILAGDGTIKVGEMRTVEIPWQGEKSCLASIRDITARKQMEEDLKEANRKILEQQQKLIEEERLKVLLQMSGATAHELNQPLSVLLGNIDLIRLASKDAKEMERCLGEIEQSGRRIASTIKKIQNIRHYETKPYGSTGKIVNIHQKIHILSIEDSDEVFEEIESALKDLEGITLSREKTLKQGLDFLVEMKPDMVLLDYLLPDGDAFAALQLLAERDLDIPAVILTGQGDEMTASRLIQAGAYDYLTKRRFDSESIAHCIRNVLEKANLKREIRMAQKKLSEMATRDELTGLFNRRYFLEALARERARAERHKTSLSLCMIDLDFFKKVNDTLGHIAGDFVLAHISGLIKSWARQSDICCRYGGEEFAVILPETSLEGAKTACERLRKTVAEEPAKWRNQRIEMSISIGVSQDIPTDDLTIERFIDRADQALYRAKEKGRNRVVGWNGS